MIYGNQKGYPGYWIGPCNDQNFHELMIFLYIRNISSYHVFMWFFMKIMNINKIFIILSIYGWVLGKLATRLHNRLFKEKGMTKFHEFILVKVWSKKSKLTRKVKVWPERSNIRRYCDMVSSMENILRKPSSWTVRIYMCPKDRKSIY